VLELDLGAVEDEPAQAREEVLELALDARDRVEGAAADARGRQRRVEAGSGALGRERRVLQPLLPRADRGLDLPAQAVRGAPGVLALVGRELRDRREEASDDAGLAEVFLGEAREARGVRRDRDSGEGLLERSFGILHGRRGGA
jgi:hypothetical protein